MTAALIISSGKTDKKAKLWPDRKIGALSAVKRIALTFQVSAIEKIVVVEDENSKDASLSSMNLYFLSLESGKEMFEAITRGLGYLKGKCDRVIIAYVDAPMFSKETVDILSKADSDIAIPSYKGKAGHPVMIKEKLFDKIISYRGEGGLRGAMDQPGLIKDYIDVDDPGILTDEKSGISYERLATNHDLSRMRANVSFKISKERNFYGPGPHQLLQLVEETGSLLGACQRMGISYSKGRKIIQTMEKEMGQEIISTKQGGKDGGGSELTDLAKNLIEAYDEFQKDAEEEIEKIFNKHFKYFL